MTIVSSLFLGIFHAPQLRSKRDPDDGGTQKHGGHAAALRR